MRFERFETGGGVALQLALGSVDVEVTAWLEDATEIDIEGRRDDDKTRAAIEEFGVEHRASGEGHVVLVREPSGRASRLRDPHIEVRIRCPEGTDVSVSGGRKDVDVRGRLGAVEVKTSSGDVVLDGRPGPTCITSASGDVSIATAAARTSVTTASGDASVGRADGELLVNTVSGDVDIREVRGGATAQSVSGDIQILSVRSGDVRVQTVSGDVSVALAQGVGVWIDAGSVSGDITSKLELEDAPADEQAGASLELRVKTVSGDVDISRAARAPVES